MTRLTLPPPDAPAHAVSTWQPSSTLPPTDDVDDASCPSIESVSGVWPGAPRQHDERRELTALRSAVRRPPRIRASPPPRGWRRWVIVARAALLRAVGR